MKKLLAMMCAIGVLSACEDAKPKAPKPGDTREYVMDELMVYYPDGERGVRRVHHFNAVPKEKLALAFATDPTLESQSGGVWQLKEGSKSSLEFVAQTVYDNRVAAYEEAIRTADTLRFSASSVTSVLKERDTQVALFLAEEPKPNDSGLKRQACFKSDTDAICIPPEAKMPNAGVLKKLGEGFFWIQATAVDHTDTKTTFEFQTGDTLQLDRKTLKLTLSCNATKTEFESASRFDGDRMLKSTPVFGPGTQVIYSGYKQTKKAFPKFVVAEYHPLIGTKFLRVSVFRDKNQMTSHLGEFEDKPDSQQLRFGGKQIVLLKQAGLEMFNKAKGKEGIEFDLPTKSYIDPDNGGSFPIDVMSKSEVKTFAGKAKPFEQLPVTPCPEMDESNE